jgi:hypothetical protein
LRRYTMRFLGTIKMAENADPAPPALYQAMGPFVREAIAAGVIAETGGLSPTAEGVYFRLEAGEVHVTDGPFSESKEVVGGYVVYDVPSREVAVDWSRRFVELHQKHWPGITCECELREMHPMEGGPKL